MKYKPIFSYPYVIYREKNIVNGKIIFNDWSEPNFLFCVKETDFKLLRDIETQLRKPKDSPADPFRKFRLIASGDDGLWATNFGDVRKERTEVRICLPAGTIFAAFEV